MIVGNLFQQAYTIVDSAIVGHYNGEAALAAVGASSALTTIFICVAIGGGIGASVIISQHFGAKRFARMKSAVYTALLTFLAVSVLLAGVGLLCSEQIMTALKTPPDALEIAVTYLNIYFYGLPFLFLYNILSSLFNALGKSRIPLYFLIFSSLLNVVLDWYFVAVGAPGGARRPEGTAQPMPRFWRRACPPCCRSACSCWSYGASRSARTVCSASESCAP